MKRKNDPVCQAGSYRGKKESGFSIVEVIAVLMLMAILTTMAMAGMGNSNAEVMGQAEMIKAHLRFAQSRAMNTDANYWGVQFDSASNAYWLFFCPTNNTACNIGNLSTRATIPGVPLDAQNRMTLMGNVTLSGQTTIVFDNFGTPYRWTGGVPTLTLQEPLSANAAANRIGTYQSISLNDGTGHTATVRISAETGYVS